MTVVKLRNTLQVPETFGLSPPGEVLMRRLFAVMILMISVTVAVQAHAPYIVAEGGDATKAIVIFSD